MFFFAFLQGKIADLGRDTSRTSVLQTNPVHCVHVLDFLAVNMSAIPEVESATSVRHKLVWKI